MTAALALTPTSMMRDLAGDPIDRMPRAASVKLRALRNLAEERHAAVTASAAARQEAVSAREHAEKRVRELRGGPYEQRKCSDDHPSMVDALAKLGRANEELARINETHDARAHRWQTVSRPKNAAEEYLRSIGMSDPIIAHTGETTPRKGETLNAAIARLRNEIREISANMHTVRSAPRPASHAKARMRAEIERLAELGRPECSA